MIPIDSTYQISLRLYFGCIIAAIVIFFIDLSIPLGVAGGVPYIVAVLIALKSYSRKFTISVAIICSILTIMGFFLSPSGGEFWKVFLNRALAIFAIWVTAILALIQQAKEKELFEEKLKILNNSKKIEIQEERLKILKATMRTVHHIVGNFLTNLQLFQLEARKKNVLRPESLEQMENLIHDTSARLKKLGDLETVDEKQLGIGIGIDYEAPEDYERLK